METTHVRKGYDAHERVTLNCGGPEAARTHQSFADETNINMIMAKWKRSQVVPIINKGTPKFGDFTNATDYHDSFTRIADADEAFMALPAIVRTRMENDPGNLIRFLQDPENRAEAIELGLVDQGDEPPLPPAPPDPTVDPAGGDSPPTPPTA